jgi:hypothetical protein
MDAPSNGNGRRFPLLLFSEKIVGVAFAVAFGLWAWYLNALANTVLEGVKEIRVDQAQIRLEITTLKAELISQQLDNTKNIIEIRERQNGVLKRLDNIDQLHRDGVR